MDGTFQTRDRLHTPGHRSENARAVPADKIIKYLYYAIEITNRLCLDVGV
jgi:hypothetical protein